MATNPKPKTEADAAAVDVDVDVAVELTADELAALQAEQAEAPITAAQFAPTDAERVPLAGLLAKKPELATAALSPREWGEALSDYLLNHEV